MAWTAQKKREYHREWRAKNMDRERALKRAWRKKNSVKALADQRTYRAKNRARIKTYLFDYVLRSRYGISTEDYDRMFKEQKGCCAICGRHQLELPKRLCVDHDHDTQAIRQLLCSYCNSGIGMFQESPERIRAAADYVEKHKVA